MSAVVGLILLFTAGSSSAATITWTNTAGGNWNVAANWNPNQIPGSNDTAEITTPGTYTVTLNVSATLAGLALGGGSGTQTLAQAANTLTVSNGTIAGTWNWSGGSVGTGSVLSIATNGRVNLSGSASKGLGGTLTNAGSITFAGTGNFQMSGAGLLHNLPGALFEQQNDRLMDVISGTPVFINEGILRKTTATGTTTWQIRLVNSGDLDMQSGTNSYASNSEFRSGTRFLGAGGNLVPAGATFSGNLTSDNLTISGGTHGGTNFWSGTVRWIGGAIGANGVFTVAANGNWQLAGSGSKQINGSLTNAGTMVFSGIGLLQMSAPGLLHNLPGAVFEQQNDRLMDVTGGVPVFLNYGIIRKTIATGSTSWQIKLVNFGDLDTQSGTNSFAGNSEYRSGTRFLGAGVNALAGGAVTLEGNITSENLLLQGASLSGTSTLSGTVRWTSGGITAGGALTVAANGTLLLFGASPKSVAGALTNAGVIAWSGSGDFEMDNSIVYNLPGALFEIQNDDLVNHTGGSTIFVNQGVLRKTAGTGNSAWQVPLVNSGDVETLTGRMTLAGGSEFQDGSRFLGAGTNVLGTGTITLSGDILSENLQLAGATLTGAGSFSGSLDWLSGSVAAALDLFIPTNGSLHLSGVSAKTVSGSVTNAGTILWEGTGAFAFSGQLHNLPGAVMECRADALLDLVGGSPVFVNEGVFRKTAGTGTNLFQVPLINSGDFEVQTGGVELAGNSAFNAGTRLLGAGVVILNSGTITLSGDIYSENLRLAGATLTGAGSFTGSLDWLSGTIAAALNLAIPTNGVLHLASSGTKTINGTVTNAGIILWEGTGNLQLKGVLHNLPGALFETRNDELLDFTGGSPILLNEGTFLKSAGTNLVSSSSSQILFRNAGRLELNSGKFSFTGGFTNLGGTVALGGGRLQLPSGHTLNLGGGELIGFGSLIGHLLNNGRTHPSGTNGVLTISGNYTQAPAGLLEFELGGLLPGVNHSHLVVSNHARFSGIVGAQLVNGFLPADGNSFQVMTYASRSGGFLCEHGFLLLGHNRRLEKQFNPVDLTFTTVLAPDPLRPSLDIHHAEGHIVVCWPVEFPGYSLESTTNLTLLNWTDLGTNAPYLLPIPSPLPESYFRLVHP